ARVIADMNRLMPRERRMDLPPPVVTRRTAPGLGRVHRPGGTADPEGATRVRYVLCRPADMRRFVTGVAHDVPEPLATCRTPGASASIGWRGVSPLSGPYQATLRTRRQVMLSSGAWRAARTLIRAATV